MRCSTIANLIIFRPILRIPTLAIHLDRSVGDGFVFNKETHLTPVLALQAENSLNQSSSNDKHVTEKHSSVLLNLIAVELKTTVDKISDFELCLFDCNNACTGGANNEFVFSARLDNLCMSFCSLTVCSSYINADIT